MSCHPHKHEALSPYTRDGPGGPTPTTTTQSQFASRLRGVLGRINAKIRESIVSRDLFGLRNEALVDEPPESVFETDNRRTAMLGFLNWLRDQLDNDFLTVVTEDTNQFLRKSYASGIRNVASQIDDANISVAPSDVNEVLGRPFHQAELRTLYSRCYDNLESVRDDVAQAVRDELLEGFREGENPTKIAKRLTDRVDSIGKARSTTIARSEVINAHTQGSIQRIRELNRDTDMEVAGTHGEFNAAVGQPDITCAFCRRLNGTPLTPDELATGTVQFRGDIYRLGPPAHPNGRCSVTPVIGPDGLDKPLSERLPAGITVVTGD